MDLGMIIALIVIGLIVVIPATFVIRDSRRYVGNRRDIYADHVSGNHNMNAGLVQTNLLTRGDPGQSVDGGSSQ